MLIVQNQVSAMPTCKYCGKTFKKEVGLHIHQLTCKESPFYNSSYAESKHRLRGPGSPWTQEQRLAQRKRMLSIIKQKRGSYKGRRPSKVIVYNGVEYDSPWEVKAQKYFDKLGIKVIRQIKRRFSYKFEGETRLYSPDFYIPKYKCYVEVKGCLTDRDRMKWYYFNDKYHLLVLSKKFISYLTYDRPIDIISPILKCAKDEVIINDKLVAKKTLKKLSLAEIRNRYMVSDIRLSSEEKSKRIKQALAKSPYLKEKRRLAKLRQKKRNSTLNKSYAGERNSQYGTYWITNGNVNKKWKDDKGNLPKGFYKGRCC